MGPGPAPGQGRDCHRHCTCAIYRGRSKTTAGPCLASCQSENPEPSQKYCSKPSGPTNSQAKGRPPSHTGDTQPSQGPSLTPQVPLPPPHKAANTISHNLAPALAPLTPSLPKWQLPTHPQEKMQCALTSDPGLPSKPLGTWRLQRDAPQRGHILRRGDCFA